MPDIRNLPVTATAPAPDDWEVIDGAVNGTRKLAASYRDTQIAARALADRLVSDGAMSGRGIFYTGVRQNVAGLLTYELAIEDLVPAASSTAELWGMASSSAATALSQAWAQVLAWSGNDLIYQQNGATPATDFRRMTWANARSNNAGQRRRFLLTVTLGTATAPVLRIENVVTAGTASDGAGTDPNWLSASGVYTTGAAGYNYPAQQPPIVVPILGSLSTAERDTWFTTGMLPAWVHLGGSAVSLITSNGNFESSSAGAGISGSNDFNNWWKGSLIAVSVETSDVPAGSTKAARLTGSGAITSDTTHWFRPNFSLSAQDPAVNLFGVYQYRFKAKHISGGSLLIGQGFNAARTITAGEAAAWTEFTGFFSAGLSFRPSPIIFAPASGAVWLIDDVQVWAAGAFTIPGPQGIGTVRDLTAIGGNQGRLVGVRPILSTPAPRNIAILPLSTTGAFLTLASTNPLAFTPQRIMRAEVVVDTAGADLTFRNNSSSTNDIVTALTDIPSANTTTQLTLIAAQTRLAAGATVWGSLSAGTGFLIIETADTL